MLYLVNSWWSQGLSVTYYCEGTFNIRSPPSVSLYYLGSIPITYTEKDKNKIKPQIAMKAVTNTT